MEVRRIRPGEFEAYREVRLRALRLAPYAFGTTLEEAASRSDDEWRAFSDRLATSTETAGFIVDRGEGVPGGLVSVRLLVEPGDVASDAEVNQMWVDEDLRGGPWAGALLDAMEGFARAIGVRRLTLWVTEGNRRAFRVYERHGYTPTGVTEPFPRGGIETQLGKALT